MPARLPCSRAATRSPPCDGASGSSPLLEGPEDWVEAAEAPVAGLVVPLRLDPPSRSDAAGDRVVCIREDACTNAGEEGRAECRSLLRLGRLEREAQHRGEDPEPELAPRASSRDAGA